MERAHGPRARGDPRRFSRPFEPPDLRLRLGEDGRGGGTPLRRPRPVARRLLLGRIPPRPAHARAGCGPRAPRGTRMSWRSIVLQVPAYAAFAAFIGYFSSAP